VLGALAYQGLVHKPYRSADLARILRQVIG
jgi:hypothetical protein